MEIDGDEDAAGRRRGADNEGQFDGPKKRSRTSMDGGIDSAATMSTMGASAGAHSHSNSNSNNDHSIGMDMNMAMGTGPSASTSTDMLDDVRRGHVNDATKLSWLTGNFSNRQWDATNNDGRQHRNQQDQQPQDQETPSSALKSLEQQLVQVKRRLWPAAVACVEAPNGATGTNASAVFAEARRRCNPLEILGEGRGGGLNQMFMNRSAIKLANVDALLGFTLLSHCVQHQDPQHSIPAFLFVDLCGAPGGFSEYIMRRFLSRPMHSSAGTRMLACRGYGMSLLGRNEHGNGLQWKLHDTNEIIHGYHTRYHVCDGHDGTGDIYRWDNVERLRADIRDDLKQCGLPHSDDGVHLVVADGGFDAQRNSEIQEQISQKLVLCEVAAAMSLLRKGGTMVVKMSGFQTDLVKFMMMHLKHMFGEIVVLKPVTSRPASAERYVACRDFHGVANNWNGQDWLNQMFSGGLQGQIIPDPMLETFDRDLLTLNLKACFSILSIMENRKNAQQNAQQNTMEASDAVEGHQIDFTEELPTVNTNLYARALGLI